MADRTNKEIKTGRFISLDHRILNIIDYSLLCFVG